MLQAALILILTTVVVLGAGAASDPPAADAFTVLDAAARGAAHHALSRVSDRDGVASGRSAAGHGSPAFAQSAICCGCSRNCGRSCCGCSVACPATRTPLNAQITGRIQMAGFHIEKLIFESLPGIFVTALLYVPDGGAAPRPAVLVPAATPPTARRTTTHLCQRLALRGYVVICWDPVGQGERSQFWDATARTKPLQPDLRRARRSSATSPISPGPTSRAGRSGTACARSTTC